MLRAPDAAYRVVAYVDAAYALHGDSKSHSGRGRIRFEFEMVFEWPIFGLFSNRIFESNQLFYTYCNRVRIRRQSQ